MDNFVPVKHSVSQISISPIVFPQTWFYRRIYWGSWVSASQGTPDRGE